MAEQIDGLNHGGVIQVPRTAVSLMYATHLAGSSYQYLALAHKIGFRNALGFSVRHFSAGDVVLRDITGARTGTVTPRDVAVRIGYARWLESRRFGPLAGSSLGMTLGYVHSDLTTEAWTFTGGLGLKTRAFHNGMIRFGLSADNLFGRLKFDRDSDPLPAIVRAGAVFSPAEEWEVSFEMDFPNDAAPFFAIGSEYVVGPIALRAGYNASTTVGLDGLSGISGGIGLSYERTTLDYALVPFGRLGQAHRVSLTFGF